MTFKLHSFSLSWSNPDPCNFKASLREESILQPSIALLLAADAELGELLYREPPDESPVDSLSKLRALDEYDFWSGIMAFASFDITLVDRNIDNDIAELMIFRLDCCITGSSFIWVSLDSSSFWMKSKRGDWDGCCIRVVDTTDLIVDGGDNAPTATIRERISVLVSILYLCWLETVITTTFRTNGIKEIQVPTPYFPRYKILQQARVFKKLARVRVGSLKKLHLQKRTHEMTHSSSLLYYSWTSRDILLPVEPYNPKGRNSLNGISDESRNLSFRQKGGKQNAI